jgi:hypothetical protein
MHEITKTFTVDGNTFETENDALRCQHSLNLNDRLEEVLIKLDLPSSHVNMIMNVLSDSKSRATIMHELNKPCIISGEKLFVEIHGNSSDVYDDAKAHVETDKSMDEYTEDMGYSVEEIQQISELELGDELVVTNLNKITRIK